MTSDNAIAVDLSGVPETLLWPLYARAGEARRPDALLRDPKAVELVDSIDYPFEARFGRPQQVLALRELAFDNQVRRFLACHPRGTVVALADGLNTQSWRLDNGEARWLSIDLPSVIELRRKLLPDTERSTSMACSALDHTWMASVDTRDGVFVTAQGLLMYLDGSDVYPLIFGCAYAFPGAALMFDAMPRSFTFAIRGNTVLNTFFMPGKRNGDNEYQLPPMPWSSSFGAARKRLTADPAIAGMRLVPLPRGRGPVFGYASPFMDRVAGLRSVTPWNTLVEFAPR